jgi:hypothetical protein
LDLCIGCCKHFNLASACEANFDLTKEPELESDDGMEREGFLKVFVMPFIYLNTQERQNMSLNFH